MATLGTRFQKERERRGWTLEDVSHVTKISARMLKAIEDEHFDQLPGGVFNKGFIRAYAKHLGLDSEQAINQYIACLRQAQIDANRALEAPTARIPARKSSGVVSKSSVSQRAASKPDPDEELPELQLPKAEHIRPFRRRAVDAEREIPWGTLALAAVVIAVGIVIWNRHSRSARAGELNPEPVAASPVATAPLAPNPTGAAASHRSRSAAKAVPAGSAQASSLQSSLRQSLSQQAPSAQASSLRTSMLPSLGNALATRQAGSAPVVAPPARTASQTPGAATEPPPAEAEQARSSAQPSPTDAAARTSPTTFTLVIRAEENSWISVTADGKTVTQETLIAPAHTTVRASCEIVVKTGNAAGVNFLLNGKEIPAQGAEAEVKTLVFDSNGLQSGEASANSVQTP